MTDAEKLARAVLLFCRTTPWQPQHHAAWQELNGQHQATPRALTELAHRVLDEVGQERAETPAKGKKSPTRRR